MAIRFAVLVACTILSALGGDGCADDADGGRGRSARAGDSGAPVGGGGGAPAGGLEPAYGGGAPEDPMPDFACRVDCALGRIAPLAVTGHQHTLP